MNSKPSGGQTGAEGNIFPRTSGSMTTSDVVTKMDREQTPPPRIEPHVDPVNGVVQPPVYPPPNRPGRITNQLHYLKTTIIKAMIKHNHSWPFVKPVNTITLGLPDYHKLIKQPMDLATVKRRLDNNYYWCGKECINDINLMFTNCYMYNKPGEDVTVMANSLEKFFLAKIKMMPPVEVDLTQQMMTKKN